MSNIWLELWTRPGHASFGRLQNEVPVRAAGITDGLNTVGGGNATIPSSWPFFDEVLITDPDTPASSEAGLFRWYSGVDPDVPFFEWTPEALIPAGAKNDHAVSTSGNGIKGILSYARLEPWDWDGTAVYAPKVPDWVYGGPDILTNGGFETQPFPNGGFEDGNNDYWQITQADGFLLSADGIQAVNNPADAESGNWYGLVNPTGPKSGAKRTFNGLIPSTVYTVTGFMFAPAGDHYRAGISGAVTATHVNAYLADGYWWADVDNDTPGTGLSDGTWQTFTLTFEAAAEMVELVVIYDTVGPGPNFRIDTWSITGDGVGLYPWEARYPTNTNTFEYQTTFAHSGVGAAAVQGNDSAYTSPYGATGFGRIGIQQAIQLKVGQPYKASVWVRQNSGSAQTFKLVIIRQSPLGAEGSPGSSNLLAVVVSVASGVWTQVTGSFIADVTEAWFYVSWMYTGAFDTALHASPTYYVDDAQLFEGLPTTTVGDILEQLYADATSDHPPRVVWDDDANPGTPYLTLDFDEALDSNGNAWDNDEISIRLTMRMSYSQIMAEFATTFGYEYRIVPDDPELGTWLWQVYNPGTMLTDRTVLAGAAIQGGSTDTQRSLRRFKPSTDVLVEGQQRITARDQDAGLVAALGRIEGAALNREASQEDGIATAAAEAISTALVAGASYSYTLVEPDVEPLVGYEIGDLLTIVDPPELDTSARFVGLTVSVSPDEVEWEAQFGQPTVTGDAAVAQGVADLLNAFQYPDELGGGAAAVQAGGMPGMMTVAVAAADASEQSKLKADFVCTGSLDHAVIMTAMEILHTAGGGTLWLSEGNFHVSGDQIIVGFSVSYPEPIIMRGLGYGTVIHNEGFTNFVIFVAVECAVRDLATSFGTIG